MAATPLQSSSTSGDEALMLSSASTIRQSLDDANPTTLELRLSDEEDDEAADGRSSEFVDDDDDDEDRAPCDFNVAHDPQHDVHVDPWTGDGCVTRCTLCATSRRSFHCRDCVQTGNFVHSLSARLGERFAEKRARYDELHRRHRSLAERADVLLEPRRRRESLQARVQTGRLQVASMQAELERRRQQLDASQRLQRRLKDSIDDARKKFPQFENNVEHLRHFVEDRLAQNEQMQAQRDQLQTKLQQRVRRLIAGLVTYVFPITQVMSRSASGESQTRLAEASGQLLAVHKLMAAVKPASPTVSALGDALPEHISALAEATRTAYVGGRWVLQDSQHELHHVVVAPSLPGNGDYSAYVEWIRSNRDGVPAGGERVERTAGAGGAHAPAELTSLNDAYRISAALTYTTQMVNLLSFYLDVHLPYRMNYGDFCNKELTAASFQRKVARLNGNILALCYSQNVHAQHLVATHTLANLQRLLGASDLGRYGAVDVSNSLVADVQHLNADLQASGDDSDSEDDNSFPHEWEAVPHLSPHETFVGPPASPLPNTSPGALLSMTTQQTTSMAGGLVNNAVASVTSIWRGFTGR